MRAPETKKEEKTYFSMGGRHFAFDKLPSAILPWSGCCQGKVPSDLTAVTTDYLWFFDICDILPSETRKERGVNNSSKNEIKVNLLQFCQTFTVIAF